MPARLRLMRPLQWIKNVVVLAGLVFSGNATDPALVVNALLAFVAFCLVSSAMYVFNDWHDRAEDRAHPVKRARPIASGEVSPEQAMGLGIALLGAGIVLAGTVSTQVAMVMLTYAILMISYTLWLRGLAFVDVGVIAVGFVLRALAGTVAVGVSISVWLFVCTLLLAITLGIGKRAGELQLLRSSGSQRRATLHQYDRINLTLVLVTSGAATISAYVMYSLAVPSYGRSVPMLVTVPFVIIAVCRYLWLVIREHQGSAPERLVFEDRTLAASVLAWAMAVWAVLAS